MRWTALYLAIGFEVAGTTALKYSTGLNRTGFFIGALLLYSVSFALLGRALETIPVGVAYAIWSAAGVVIIAAAGWVIFREPFTSWHLLFVTMIVIGAVGLHLLADPVPA